MIERARDRLRCAGDGVRLWVGDAAIAAPDATFDAVFDFGIIHHVPDWRGAVAEVARVLRPGGRFFFEEVTLHALSRRFYRTFFEHPTADRFSGREFVTAIEGSGILVGDRWTERFFGDFVFGVGIRSSS